MAHNVDNTRASRLTLAAFGSIVLIGGVNFVAVRFSNRELPPFWGAGLRFTAAAALLFAVVILQRLPLPRGRALFGTAAYGVLAFGASYALGYWGLLKVPAGVAAVTLASAPLLTFVLALIHRQERFRWSGLAGGLLALAGIAVLFRQSVGSAVPLASLLAIVAMAVCFAEAGILIKQFPRSHPVSTNAVAMSIGALILLTISAISREPWVIPAQTSTWAALAYLVVLGSSTVFVLFLFVLRHWSASAVAYQFVLFPIVAMAVASWLEGDRVTLPMAFGTLVILGGVYVGAIAHASEARLQARMASEPCISCPD